MTETEIATVETTSLASPTSAPTGRRIFEAVVVSVLMAAVGWSVYRQGFDLDHDGLWLLGSSRLLQSGHLYRDFEPGDGPLNYWILAPLLWLQTKYAALALLRTITLVGASVGGMWWLRRRGVGVAAWAWPAALVALGPIDPPELWLVLGVFLVLSRWRGSAAAMGALLLSSLALDPAVAIATLVFATAAHFAREGEDRGNPATFAAGAVGIGLVLVLIPLIGGEWTGFVRNTFVHPWRTLFDHLHPSQLGGWWQSLRHGPWIHDSFAEVGTGEILDPVWPGQFFLHRWSLRGLALLVFVGAPALTWVHRRNRPWLWLCAAVSVVAPWIYLVHGDVPSLRQAGLVVTALWWVTPTAKGRRPKLRPLLLGLLLLPLTGEQLWLSARIDRPELAEFRRAGVFASQERQLRLEEFFHRIEGALDRPIVIWPQQAGLHLIYGAEPALPYLRMTGLHLAPDTRAHALVAADPQVILLAQNWSSTAQRFRTEDPLLWTALRDRYRIAGWLRGRTDRFRLLVRMEEEESFETLPLNKRLPLVELTVSNDLSPALRRDLTIGQSFRTAGRDLSGVVVKWSTRGKDLHFEVRVRVWQKLGTEFDTLLTAHTTTVEVPGDGARSFLRLEVPETRNAELAVTLELRDDLTDELRLYWHRHDEGDADLDLFPEGAALLDLQPTDADLYFSAY